MSQPNSSKESPRFQSLSDCFAYLLTQTDARQESSGQFKGTCPAHEDHQASLSFKLEGDRILLNCFAGCDFNNISEKLGVDPKELFADLYQDNPPPRKSKQGFKKVAEYIYTDPHGNSRYAVLRMERFNQGKKEKSFLQVRINNDGSRVSSMKGIRRVPYRLPQLIEAIEKGKTLLLVEGEKDVETAERLGFIATTFPQGAGKSEVADQCIEWLKDADVVLIPDNDESGQSHMQMIGEKLLPVARSIRLLQLPDLGEKEDLSDWVQKGGTGEELKKLVDHSPIFTPSGSPESPPEGSFTPFDEIVWPEPKWLIKGILRRESMIMVYGESGSGKSFLALDLGACIATGKAWHGRKVSQGKVLYMAAEGRPGLQLRHLAWKQANDLRTGKQMLLSAGAADLSNEEVIEKLQRDIRSIPESENIKLVIVDTLASHNLGDENSTQDMSRFIDNLGKIQREFKVAIMLVHHVGQAQGNKQRARGSSAIKASLDTEILIEKNSDGTVNLKNTKQKDFKEFEPMSFQLNEINLQDTQGRELADEDGDPITSCVLEQIGYVQPETPKVAPGKNQEVFIECFEELLKNSQAEDRVKTTELREAVRMKINKPKFNEIWGTLKKGSQLKQLFEIGEVMTIRK